jgi:hypothetical protein
VTRTDRRLRALVLATVALLLAATALASLPTRAEAANMAAFDPGYLISDTVFYDSSAMSADAVQSFLSTKGAACRPAADGTACLKDYRQTTATRAADARCTGTYQGAANESAATIITKVAQACGINPRVLLVTLQKEQSLVTRTTAGSASVYQKAMGYACPDTAACDSKYYGFFNQVYSAASQLRGYALNPTRFNHRAGAVNTIRYYPASKPECGSSQVYIRNQATASLYNYTPYQPNAAALAAGLGTGDSCSSYGNRNFWVYFTDWFGSAYTSDPIGFLDAATAVGPNTVRLSGWALDPDTYGPLEIHVYVDGQPTGGVANQPRPDIGAAYPGWGDNHGFTIDAPVSEGTHQACAYAINQPAGTNPLLGCRTVTTVNTAPTGFLDSVSATPSTIRVAGWTWDPDTTAALDVHVYVDSTHVGVLRADQARADVGAAHPAAGGSRGFSGEFDVAAGNHRVCVYPINVPASANPALGCAQVSVVNAEPSGFVDEIVGTTGAVRVGGWAWDADAGAATGIHVYVDGRYAGATATGLARPDVAASVPGVGAATGFSAELPASPGTHTVCVYAINAPAGVNPVLRCASGVTVG